MWPVSLLVLILIVSNLPLVSGASYVRETRPAVIGEQKILVLLMKFQDMPSEPDLPSHYSNRIFSEMNAYYLEASFGQVSVSGKVYGWYTLPQPWTYYVNSQYLSNQRSMMEDSIRAADRDVDFRNFRNAIIVFNNHLVPPPACCVAFAEGDQDFQTANGLVKLSVLLYPVTEGDPAHAPLGTPLLGLYNSNDPLVIAKHIDWATGYGIDFFLFDFWGRVSVSWRFPPLLQHPLIGDIKFAVSYATQMLTGDDLGQLRNISLSSPDIYSRVESDFDYVAANYFSHPSYLRVNGRPLISMYHADLLGGDILEPLTRLRQHLKQLGFDVYFVGDVVDVGAERIDLKRLRAFDAISNASGIVPLPVGPSSKMERMSMADARNELRRWTSAAHSVGVEFVPFAYPGYDDSHLVDRPVGYGYTPRSPEFFSSELKMAIDFADENRLLGIVEFDGWGENTYIEPSVEDGFKYLQTLRDTLAGDQTP